MAIYPCPIPKMDKQHIGSWVHPPPYDEVQFTSDGYAVVSLIGMERLPQYDNTLPSGVYAGKMWKRQENDEMYLYWYQPSGVLDKCDVRYRKILSKEVFELLNPGGEGNV
jgi:hypothetical protein